MMNKTPGNDFDVMTLRLASPSRILEWSRGEVTKAETINYRTQRSEKHGLFDEKIFGPEKDYECYCGKYRGIRYKGIVCEKCGVEVTRAIVRRERMGHIELASPVAHVWFLRGVPSRIALILGIPAADAEKVIYFASYIVVKVVQEDKDRFLKELDNEYKTKWKSLEGNEQARDDLKEKFTTTKSEIEGINIGRVLDEGTYHRFSVRYGTIFEASTGAEAIYSLFKKVDVEGLLGELEGRREKATALEREKLTKRISLLKAMRQSGVRPEWMFLTHIPVMPPALRPMVALEGGRHATSDLNDLYRRVINRNNRLKKLREIGAPEVILRNEKRILQEAVDALIDNTIRRGGAAYSALTQAQRRPLKSLSDYLKGKHGYFRANLLGKRVDYSGRSVIVVGPELKLDQCGLPKHMALELFKPFVIAKLLERELAYNIRGAGRLIEEGVPEVWGILEEVITGRHVLLNRAPTLHRQGIQAFRPVLIEGNAIQLHPLVCRAFNADFDGDQMAVHVPLSEEAQLEAREIMSANKNILKPGSGTSVVSEKMLDIAYGTYYTTSIKEGELGEGKDFPTPNAAIAAMDYGAVSLRARIKVLGTDSPKYAEFGGKVFETSVGRLLFNSILPAEYPFVNAEVTQKVVGRIVDELIERFGLSRIPEIIDRVKAFGFHYATKSGLTWAIDDIIVPEAKHAIIEKAKQTVNEIVMQYEEGLLSEDERVRLSIEIWTRTKLEVEKLVKESLDRESPVFGMVESGARGSWAQLTMMVGMKGLTQSTTGEAIEFPIVASLKEGLSPIEYFLTTHGSRSGLANVALGTARAGYLTRRLFDVAQDSLVIEDDCGSTTGIPLTSVSASGIETNISKIIKGRTLSQDLPAGEMTFKANHTLNSADALAIERAGVTEVWVRSPMACETLHGSCRKCYGFDQTTNALIDVGEAVGTIAAQAIGEPGTQLSMNTKHAGGAASLGGDITQGLPRIEELFENRTPKTPAVISHVSGTITDIRDAEGGEKVIVIAPSLEDRNLNKKMGDLVEYDIPFRRTPLVRMGEDVVKGQILTDGSADLSELFTVAGRVRTQAYLIAEVSKIYELQGVSISRKHIEVIVRHMFGRVRITRPGDTRFAIGDVAEEWDVREENARVGASHGSPAEANPILLGITDAAINRKSFLSAASFQNTTRVLINASVRGSTDPLSGLKENVIIGRLIPAGSGFPGSAKHAIIGDLQAAMTPPAPEPEVSIVPTLEEALGEK